MFFWCTPRSRDINALSAPPSLSPSATARPLERTRIQFATNKSKVSHESADEGGKFMEFHEYEIEVRPLNGIKQMAPYGWSRDLHCFRRFDRETVRESDVVSIAQLPLYHRMRPDERTKRSIHSIIIFRKVRSINGRPICEHRPAGPASVRCRQMWIYSARNIFRLHSCLKPSAECLLLLLNSSAPNKLRNSSRLITIYTPRVICIRLLERRTSVNEAFLLLFRSCPQWSLFIFVIVTTIQWRWVDFTRIHIKQK